MIESIIALAVACAIQSVVLASLPFLLWQFIAKEQRLRQVERDLEKLDEVVEGLGQRLGVPVREE